MPILHVGYSHTLSCIVRDQLIELRGRGWEIHVACPQDEWASQLARDGFPLWPIRLPHRASVQQALQGSWDLLRALRGDRFSLVHTNNAHHGVAGRAVARASNLPSLHTWRYSPLDAARGSVRRAMYGLAEGAASRAGNLVLFQNQEDLEEAVRLQIVPATKARLVGNGIDLERFARTAETRATTRADLDLDPKSDVILCVGRLVERKGQEFAIRAMNAVRRERSNAVLLLAGSGPEARRLNELATGTTARGSVRFLGHRTDVVDLLHAADVLCLPSRREGAPRAVLEAMAAGLPTVATNVIGTRAVLRDGHTGLLVPYGRVEALAGAIVRLLSDRDLARRLAANGEREVHRRWNIRDVATRVSKLYSETLGIPEPTWPAASRPRTSTAGSG